MEYIEPIRGSWVGHNGDLEQTLNRIVTAQHVVADLDYTLADCLVFKKPFFDLMFWKKGTKVLDPSFYRWGFRSVGRVSWAFIRDSLDKVSDIENDYPLQLALEESWLDYNAEFIEDNPEELDRIEQLVGGQLEKAMYKGVKDFYGYLLNAHTSILTRNIKEFTCAFASELGSDMHTGYIHNRMKVKFLEDYLRDIEGGVVLIGDEEALTDPIKTARELVPDDELVGIYVSKKQMIPEGLEPDIHIPRDYRGLSACLETMTNS